MATALKTKNSKPKAQAVEKQATETQAVETQNQEPKRLSKAAIWRLNNPNGILTVVDWRAVNK